MLRFFVLFVMSLSTVACVSQPQTSHSEVILKASDAEERLQLDDLFLKKSQSLGAARLRNSNERLLLKP